MNRPSLLHVVERLEGLVGRLPATIQKPILSELTPLKELFLRQRPPRFLFTGSQKASLPQILSAIFSDFAPAEIKQGAIHDRWRDFTLGDRGTISLLDARDSGAETLGDELEKRPADVIFFIDDSERRKLRKEPIEDLATIVGHNDRGQPNAAVIGIIFAAPEAADGAAEVTERAARLHTALESNLKKRSRLLRILAVGAAPELESDSLAVISALAQQLPNEARIEMARVFKHRKTQIEIAQLLVKSTTAICTAIGAQPIPLADLPILTTLQLVMVSGIMYVSGRERSLRAATEFVAALGANVGAGMLLREGARTILKFVPGWGNVVCGMIAGAGTYAIGRAATAYFLEGVSLKDARRTYLSSRKRRALPSAPTDSAKREKQPLGARTKPARRLRLRR
jgi:uncharacterized protein (DUF697 family)